MNFSKIIASSFIAATILTSCDSEEISNGVLEGENSNASTATVDLSVPSSLEISMARTEAQTLLNSIATDGGEPYNQQNPAVRYTDAQRVFVPSALGIDYRLRGSETSTTPSVKMPMFKGYETLNDGSIRDAYYIITEASDREIAKTLGVAHAPRMAAAKGSEGVQLGEFNDEGRLVFEGSVDFSFKRRLTPGTVGAEGTDAFGLLSFPPAESNAGAVASDAWSSYVVLPSGIVINAQEVGNESGLHDRIATSDTSLDAQDDFENPNFSPSNAEVVLQLLDGWQNNNQYFFHLVTDASDPAPSAIEKGVFAPRLANIPSFGVFPGGAFLGFSPCANGNPERDAQGRIQGLNNTIDSENQDQDPTNTFPIDPLDVRFSPMWDAHICEWNASVPLADRPILTSISQIQNEIANGRLDNFRGNNGPKNQFLAGLMPTGAIINCPVITHPQRSVIGTVVGNPAPIIN